MRRTKRCAWMMCTILALQACGAAEYPTDPEGDGGSLDLPGSWTSVAPLPFGIAGGSAAAHEGRIYVAGGYDADRQASSSVLRYDPQADAWEELAALPEALAGLAMVSSGGRLLVIGGNASATSLAARRHVWALDDATETWVEDEPLPIQSSSPLAGGVVGGVLAIRLGDGGRPPGDSTAFLDLPAARWSWAAPPPFEPSLLAGNGSEAWIVSTSRVATYDRATDTWNDRGLFPGIGTLLGAWSDATRLGVLHRDGGTSDHSVFDVTTGSWNSFEGPPGSESRFDAMSALLEGRVYLIGGAITEGVLLRRVDRFDEGG